MAGRIQFKRGLYANLPANGMLAGEFFFATDRGSGHIALDATTRVTIVPAVDELANMPAIDAAADFLMITDMSQAGRKEKRITIADFKAALNIPAGASDEKVAAYAGGAGGYLFGTDGTDGVLRLNASLAVTKQPDGSFGTLSVGTIDCGTF